MVEGEPDHRSPLTGSQPVSEPRLSRGEDGRPSPLLTTVLVWYPGGLRTPPPALLERERCRSSTGHTPPSTHPSPPNLPRITQTTRGLYNPDPNPNPPLSPRVASPHPRTRQKDRPHVDESPRALLLPRVALGRPRFYNPRVALGRARGAAAPFGHAWLNVADLFLFFHAVFQGGPLQPDRAGAVSSWLTEVRGLQ